jgi:hypothetical protein
VSSSAWSGADEAPDYAEPVEAWRVWRVVAGDGGYRLGSVVKPTLWPPAEPLVAQCLRNPRLLPWLRRGQRGERPVPGLDCECGIYAAELSELGPYLSDTYLTPPVMRVLGKVSLWGTVIECERGYRASHGYPSLIYVPADAVGHGRGRYDELLRGLETYGVPVERVPARCAEAAWVLEQKQFA